MAIFLLALPALLLIFFACQALASWIDTVRFPPPGELITTASGIFHVQRMGAEGPTVLLEAGLAASSLSWVLVQAQMGVFARAVSYDRAGLGFSPVLQRKGHGVEQSLADLHEVLERLPAPHILVGHSFGGLLVRGYAHLHPEVVAGIVLIDPVSIEAWSNPVPTDAKRLALGAKLCRRGAWLARLGIVRAALSLVASGGNRVPLLIGRVSAGKGTSVMARLAREVSKLPPETHPLIRAQWSRARSFTKLAEYLEDLPEAARKALQMPVPIQVPMIILSAATATSAELKERDGWITNRPASRHALIPETSHWIQFDRPDVVIATVEEMVDKIGRHAEHQSS